MSHGSYCSRSLSGFNLASPLSFLRESSELEEKSDHFELSGARIIIGSNTMLVKMSIVRDSLVLLLELLIRIASYLLEELYHS